MKKYIPPIEAREIKERPVYWKQSRLSTHFWEWLLNETKIPESKGEYKANLFK